MPPPEPNQRRRLLRATLRARAWDVVAGVGGRPPRRPVTVSASDGAVRVDVTVGPAEGGGPPRPPGVYGLFLSALEAAVVQALSAQPAAALSGRAIADRLGRTCDTPFKYLLSNLEERRVIDHTPNEGYRLAGPVPADDT